MASAQLATTTVNLGRLLLTCCISCSFSSCNFSYVAPFSFLMEFQSFSLIPRSWAAILQKKVVCKCWVLNFPSLISACSEHDSVMSPPETTQTGTAEAGLTWEEEGKPLRNSLKKESLLTPCLNT